MGVREKRKEREKAEAQKQNTRRNEGEEGKVVS